MEGTRTAEALICPSITEILLGSSRNYIHSRFQPCDSQADLSFME